MKAQIINNYGDPNVFETATVAKPEPRAGEVLVQINATSINPVDWKIRRKGLPISPDLPAILGCDIAGTVVALGSNVKKFNIGDEVFGCGGGVKGMGGTYAEFISTDERLLAKKPSCLSMREAAALPLVSITAWDGLKRAGLKVNENILVHGGAGGVGHVAIQLARSFGANVFTTVSSNEKSEIAISLGAKETIDYNTIEVEEYVQSITNGKGFDVVFDATGGSNISNSFAASKLNGNVVSIVSQFDADLTLMQTKGLSLHIVFMLIPMLHNINRDSHGKIMEQIASLAEAKKLKPIINQNIYTLNDIHLAHQKLESDSVSGKIVIDIS
mgnify:CR=1 FL=1